MQESIKQTIRIDSEVKDDKRAVYFNDEFSHHIDEGLLIKVLNEAKSNFWKSNHNNQQSIGSSLCDMLNGSGGHLLSSVQNAHDTGKPLYIYLKLPTELSSLPFELLHDNRYLLMDSRVHLIRRVNDENRSKVETPPSRPLKVLFMACSPTDLKAHQVLSFEKEEELIIETVGDYPLSLTIEDSGSLKGLEHAIYEANGYDVVHITGHAGIDKDYGPVFYMENDIGEIEKVTALMLYEKIKAFPPKILFLSGCSTAKTDTENASESFAHLMIEQGIPVALGWGLPISDTGAARIAALIYKYLSIGKNIGEAVQTARQEMETDYHVWPLLRAYTDGTPFTPVVASGQALFMKTPRATTYKYLKGSNVKVLEKGFVGRRRQIQTGVKVLKGKSDKCGLLIHGTAGLGKSCLAGKLIERFNKKELVVIHGELKTSDLFQKLLNMFDKRGIASGIQTLKSDMEANDRIKQLFRTVFKEQPSLLYFDDFEQNLEWLGDKWHVKPDTIELMKTILTALDWSEGNTNLIITSCYPFVLEAEGENLPYKKLEEISLMSFKGADLRKKKEELKYIPKSKHAEMYMQVGCGNPRLLEWLDKIAEEENKYDLEGLKQELAGKSEDFISKYLADVIAKSQSADFHNFLHKASVFRQPVVNTAYHKFGSDDLLNRGVDLTLFEKEQTAGQNAVFWVTPVIRAQMFDKLDERNKTEMHKTAYDWYDKRLHGSENSDPVFLEEAIHHALESGNIRGACRHAITLAHFMKAMLLYRESANLMQTVADRITTEVIDEAKNHKAGDVPTLFNQLGIAWSALGDNKKALDCFTKALEIVTAVFGERHPYIATINNNVGSAWRDLGDNKKAIDYFTKALAINTSVFGEKHPNVAIGYNNFGSTWSALGDNKKAIDYFTKALEIDISFFGEKHPKVATRYNNLGLAWNGLGDNKKAIDYYTKALEIVTAVFGERHPYVATTNSNFGLAWKALGDNKKAIDYYTKALEIDISVFGEKHPNVATGYINLGTTWSNLGDNKKAIDYFTKALEINISVLGEKHPNVAINYNNLGGAWKAFGDNKKAIDYFTKALEIDISFFGEKHPNVAMRYNNLGGAWRDLGDMAKAIGYVTKALEIISEMYGNEHPSTKTFRANLDSLNG